MKINPVLRLSSLIQSIAGHSIRSLRNICMTALFLGISFFAFSQNPYTQAQYSYDSLLNVTYGTAIDYSGNPVNLKMDIFKPIGDQNCKRPIILFLHGGAWVVGSKEDESMHYMAKEMAKRGWVAASINYRLGTHKNPTYSMNLLCNTSLSEPCAYICDTAEAIRANFRAMQDAKAAVRFMKSRYMTDSTDFHNVFMAGESAGAFTSFLVGYLDRDSEKPGPCFAIEDAPQPSSYFNSNPCISQPLNLSRPDLGSTNGDLNLGSFDATIHGIGSFFGAVFDLSIFEENINQPCVYLFAQGSDVIVHYDYGKLFGRIDSECYNNFLCQNYQNYPYCYGNEGLRNYFETNPHLNIDFYADIIDNYSHNGNCFASGHEIDDKVLRLQNMTDYFAEKIQATGNNPSTNCNTSSIGKFDELFTAYISNNPTSTEFFIHIPDKDVTEAKYQILNQLGQVIASGNLVQASTSVDVTGIKAGLYFVNLSNNYNAKTLKLLVK